MSAAFKVVISLMNVMGALPPPVTANAKPGGVPVTIEDTAGAAVRMEDTAGAAAAKLATASATTSWNEFMLEIRR